MNHKKSILIDFKRGYLGLMVLVIVRVLVDVMIKVIIRVVDKGNPTKKKFCKYFKEAYQTFLWPPQWSYLD